MIHSLVEEVDILHYHGFCGMGGGADGFNKGRAQLNGIKARFRCIGGFDVSPAAIRDFNRLAKVPGTVLDLFSRDQYIAFHGHEPPKNWREVNRPTGSVINVKSPGQGAFAVADPRGGYGPDTHKNVYRIIRWNEPSQTIGGGHGPSSGGMSVADPRMEYRRSGALGVRLWSEASGAVAGESLPPNGSFAVADPRFPNSQGEHGTKYLVQQWDDPSRTITGSDRIGSGALCIADPRMGMQRERGDNYLTAGHYGVVPWDEPSGAVSAAAGHDNGRWNVADPRLPEADDKGQWFIRSLDGTWHRPFTTLELAGLQSLIDPEDIFDLDGNSDSAKRERIGNAVPPAAAQAIADLMGQTLLMAWTGQTFALSSTPIWVRPIAVALSVKTPEVLG